MTEYDPQKHHRRSIRLKGYDYSLPGAYFVTICTQHMECRFGEVINDVMRLNAAGLVVQHEWEHLPQRFSTMRLDEFVVMPNHLHGIVVIVNSPVGASLVDAQPSAGTSPAPTGRPTLSEIIGAFKSITTNEYIQGVREFGWPQFNRRVWQRNFYDHIIRNEREYNAIRQYIRNNPLKWGMDRDNPTNLPPGKER